MRIFILFPLFVFFSLQTLAQDKEKNKIEALKIAFITDMLDLDKKTAQEFWPVYNKYEEKEDNYRMNLHCGIYDKMDNLKSMSDTEAQELLKEYMKLREHEYELRENYVSALEKVISPRQIMLLRKAEYDFHRKLLKEYRSENKK